MRISDWSSDVCSSDLRRGRRLPGLPLAARLSGGLAGLRFALGIPDAVAILGDLLHAAAADDARRRLPEKPLAATGLGRLVAAFDQEPILAALLPRLALHSDEMPLAGQPLAPKPAIDWKSIRLHSSH